MGSHNIIEARNLVKHFERKIVLSSLSFTIKKGELVALIGPSGAGKTTLLNALSARMSPDQGELMIDGRLSTSFRNDKELAKKVGMIRQQFDLVGQLPVIHNVLAGRLNKWGLFRSLLSLLVPQEKEVAVKALSRVGLRDKLNDQTSLLSGGEQQRVALARLLVQSPEVILADEPVSSLDPARAEDIIKILTALVKEEGQTLIASLHTVDYAFKYFTRVIALRNGKIAFDLPPEEISARDLETLYRLKELN